MSGRSPLRASKPLATNTPAREHGPNRSASTPGRPRAPAIRSYALRASFFGHPMSAYPGPPKILSRRAQVVQVRRVRPRPRGHNAIPWVTVRRPEGEKRCRSCERKRESTSSRLRARKTMASRMVAAYDQCRTLCLLLNQTGLPDSFGPASALGCGSGPDLSGT